MMDVIRRLQDEGHPVDAADLTQISPYLTEHIKRFGDYATDEITLTPDDFDPHLDVDFDALHDAAAA